MTKKRVKKMVLWGHMNTRGNLICYEEGTPDLSRKKPDMSYVDDSSGKDIDCMVIPVTLTWQIPAKKRS